MNKTYFAQLSDLVNSIKNPDATTEYVYKDCLRRSLDWINSHYMEGVHAENDAYVKRQLDFLKNHLDR